MTARNVTLFSISVRLYNECQTIVLTAELNTESRGMFKWTVYFIDRGDKQCSMTLKRYLINKILRNFLTI